MPRAPAGRPRRGPAGRRGGRGAVTGRGVLVLRGAFGGHGAFLPGVGGERGAGGHLRLLPVAGRRGGCRRAGRRRAGPAGGAVRERAAAHRSPSRSTVSSRAARREVPPASVKLSVERGSRAGEQIAYGAQHEPLARGGVVGPVVGRRGVAGALVGAVRPAAGSAAQLGPVHLAVGVQGEGVHDPHGRGHGLLGQPGPYARQQRVRGERGAGRRPYERHQAGAAVGGTRRGDDGARTAGSFSNAASTSAGSIRTPLILTWSSRRPRNSSSPSAGIRTRSPVRYTRSTPGRSRSSGTARKRRAVSSGSR